MNHTIVKYISKKSELQYIPNKPQHFHLWVSYKEILFEYLAFIYIDETKKSSNSQVFGNPLPLFFESVSMD